MNQRIKELALEAGRTGLPYGEIEIQKFAELIAEDCARMLDEDSYIIPELGGYAHDIRIRYGVK